MNKIFSFEFVSKFLLKFISFLDVGNKMILDHSPMYNIIP